MLRSRSRNPAASVPVAGRAPRATSLPAGSAALAILLLGSACGRNARTTTDAAEDNILVDMAPTPDNGPRPLALDFSATGCASFDLVHDRCEGNAPLTLALTPVASVELTRFLWDFGDGSPPSSERSPSHTYSLPGAYDVTLVAGAVSGGTVSQNHVGYVNVIRAPIGARCDVDLQCATGLTCFCGSMTPCRPILDRGFCSRLCDPATDQDPCPDGTDCANLAIPPTPPPPPTPPMAASSPNDSWRHPLCLPVCTDDAACASGFGCRDLLATPGGNWVRACFRNYPFDIGQRCDNATGQPVNGDCAGQVCASLGAFGRCSAVCDATTCPVGTACAHFGDGRILCLAPCAGSTSCTDDPLLDCEAPGATGALGFSVSADPAAVQATYCAPKRCSATADCGPAGTCPTGGGHCHPLPPPTTN